VSFGILNPLYDLVGWLIMRIQALFSPLFGASSGVTWVLVIVTLVVLMRLILLPLFVKQMHSQRKMIALAPELQALRKRYKNDKQKLQEEMMKLYKEHGANPLSGCLPLVAQLPIWFALLNVLRAMSEDKALYGLTPQVVHNANHASIFGATISSKFLFQHPSTPGHVKVVIGITVVISAVTTFLSVRQSMKRGLMQNPAAAEDNPMAGAQKYMVYIAPLFALSGLYWQFGLVLYWMTSNIWQLGQQYFLFKKIPPLETAPAAATAATAASGKASGSSAQAAAARPKGGSGQPGAKRPASASAKSAGSGAKPTGSGKPAAAQQSGSSGKPASASAKSAAASAKQPARAKQPAAAKKPAAEKTDAAALGVPPPTPNGSGGVLRKLVRGRAEPEPEPEPPEVTFVRQQRVKQSRSKRSGKR
jgi:YidC/Oxa1 family membrane protein insertase